MNMRRPSLHTILAGLAGIIPFFVYAATAPRTIFLGDNAEFLTAGATLGIPHPPGYPLLTILLKLFSFLPWGSLEWRMNLLSCVAASVGLVFLYLITTRLLAMLVFSGEGEFINTTTRAWLGAATTLLFAFTGLFWSQAIVAEAYALNFLFFTVLLWLLLCYWKEPRGRTLFVVAFLYGLGLGNHHILLLFTPFFLIGFIFGKAPMPRPRQVATAIIFFFLGLLVYAYLPLRSAQHPALDWGGVSRSVEAFWNHVLRRAYQDYGNAGYVDGKLVSLLSFGFDLLRQFGGLLVLAPVGLWAIFKKLNLLGWLMVGMFVFSTAGLIAIRSLPYTEEAAANYSVYYLPAYAIVLVWMAIGASAAFRFASTRFSRAAAYSRSLPVLFLVMGGVIFAFNFQENNLSGFQFLNVYSTALLENLELNAVLAVAPEGPVNDSLIFSLKYQQAVRNLRPDVTIVSLPQVFASPDSGLLSAVFREPDLRKQRVKLLDYILSQPRFSDRPIYTTFLAEVLRPQDWQSFSNGTAYRLSAASGEKLSLQVAIVSLTDADYEILQYDLFGNDLLAQYYYAQGALAADMGNLGEAQTYFIAAIQSDYDVSGADHEAFRFHRNKVFAK
ncbi:MAG: hypothetical protein A2722_03890 [Candidatus Doudnabacteria bacterium RIFCSPHIGHO2_01_FULL_50_11]|uniref:DUF2723 domain-containing protein n=1 Tax=Candidatus Doudnabacteria bacterium RIFCSPHIGHO2_01_FULL_50_11 TaxID=1817828 RepID=A0A1F5PEG6_9BACT|nr:MAG: hypothetical protein A2722_03890 [Candidatus Doudnabacteria bacterium RIFCSPHIGHO2_01_FULL_50_11]HLC45122.1 DUF2723 domain-containing protein [Patescibacteria group bacterium]